MQPEISFYQLTTTPLPRALPTLLEKAYEAGMRVLVLTNDVKMLDDSLWTSYQQKFLPHGTKDPEIQPIFLSDKIYDDNTREVLAITNGEKYEGEEGYKKVLDIFDGNIETDLVKARARWKLYKDQGFTMKYWQQDDKGKWLEK